MNDKSSEKEFALGEIVQLRSGGPFMTIVGVIKEKALTSCGWFWSGRYRTERFYTFELARPSPEAVQTSVQLRNTISKTPRASGEGTPKNSPAG